MQNSAEPVHARPDCTAALVDCIMQKQHMIKDTVMLSMVCLLRCIPIIPTPPPPPDRAPCPLYKHAQ
jgi:hypothetical protein